VHGTKLWSNLEKHLTRSRNEVKQFNTSTKSNKLHYPYQNNNKFRKVYCHRQSGTAVRIGCNIHWQVSFPHLQCVCVCFTLAQHSSTIWHCLNTDGHLIAQIRNSQTKSVVAGCCKSNQNSDWHEFTIMRMRCTKDSFTQSC
jgi:hypothetical protein